MSIKKSVRNSEYGLFVFIDTVIAFFVNYAMVTTITPGQYNEFPGEIARRLNEIFCISNANELTSLVAFVLQSKVKPIFNRTHSIMFNLKTKHNKFKSIHCSTWFVQRRLVYS